MDCATSLALLSDFHDGLLNETDGGQVRLHLTSCTTCKIVFDDLGAIIITAVELRSESATIFPDENVIWQRLAVGWVIN